MTTQYGDRSVDDLRLDPQNPRFVGSQDTTDLATFLPWFEQDADLFSVAASIATNGYFGGEPLLVAPGEDDDPRLVVVEGNRRFAAVLLLLNPGYLPRAGKFQELANEADLAALSELPCAVYPDRRDILKYLGNRHIAGVREWKPLAKANYLRQLRESMTTDGEPPSDRQLAKSIGSNAPTVRRLLNSLEAYNAADLEEKDEGPFSVLQTALGYGNIADYVGIGQATAPKDIAIKHEALNKLADWTLKPSDPGRPRSAPRVNSRKLEDLNAVVAHPDALAAFENGQTLERALRLTGASSAALSEAIQEAGSAVEAAREHVHRLDVPPTTAQIAAASDLAQAASELEHEVRDRVTDADDSSATA